MSVQYNSSALYSLGIKIDQMTEKLTSSPDANAKTHVHDCSPQHRAKAAQRLQKLKKDLSNEQKVAIMDLFKTNMAAADMFLVLEEKDESLRWAWISNKLLQMGHPALPPCQSAMELEWTIYGLFHSNMHTSILVIVHILLYAPYVHMYWAQYDFLVNEVIYFEVRKHGY